MPGRLASGLLSLLQLSHNSCSLGPTPHCFLTKKHVTRWDFYRIKKGPWFDQVKHGKKWSTVQLFCFFRYIDWFRYVCWNDWKHQAWERVKTTADSQWFAAQMKFTFEDLKTFFLDCTNYSPGWCSFFFVRAYRKFIHWTRAPFRGATKIGTRKNVVLEASKGKRGQEVKGGGPRSRSWFHFLDFEHLFYVWKSLWVFFMQHFDLTNKEFWTFSIRICKWFWFNVGFWQFLGVFLQPLAGLVGSYPTRPMSLGMSWPNCPMRCLLSTYDHIDLQKFIAIKWFFNTQSLIFSDHLVLRASRDVDAIPMLRLGFFGDVSNLKWVGPGGLQT